VECDFSSAGRKKDVDLCDGVGRRRWCSHSADIVFVLALGPKTYWPNHRETVHWHFPAWDSSLMFPAFEYTLFGRPLWCARVPICFHRLEENLLKSKCTLNKISYSWQLLFCNCGSRRRVAHLYNGFQIPLLVLKGPERSRRFFKHSPRSFHIFALITRKSCWLVLV